MKLSLRFVLLVLALLTAVGVSERQGAMALDRLGAALQQVVDSDMERVFAITHVRRLFRSMVVLEGDYLLSKTGAERTAMDKKMVSLAKEQKAQIDKYASLMLEEDAPAIANIRAVRDRWIALNSQVRELASNDHEKALETSKLHAKDPVSWEKVIGSLVKLSETRLSKQVAETKVIHARAKRNLSTVAFTAMGVALGFGLFIYFGIRRNVKDLVVLNTNLERLITERTTALAERERSLHLVLDSTGDAFIEVDREGRLSGVMSAATVRWFGECAANSTCSQYLFGDDPALQKVFNAAFSQLVDDILPWELTAEQMPKRYKKGDAVLEFEYKKILENDKLSRILIVARDISVRLQSEATEQHAREQQAVLSKLLSDKAGFVQFVADCEKLIANITGDPDIQSTKRNLHTLKGNTAVYGMASIAEFAHKLEDSLASSGEPLPSSSIADLGALWRSKLQGIQEFLSGIGDSVLEIAGDEHQQLIDSLMSRRDYQEILAMVEMWSWCRASERLARLRAQTEYISKRLEKDIIVVMEHNDVRIPKDYLNQFWPVLIHVVRNAIGHGIESPNDRTAHGKPPQATITFATYESNHDLVLEVRDDGRGIDTKHALSVAEERHISLPKDPSLIDIVTAIGVSTSAETTELSGRGVGLAAVNHACTKEGGTMSIVNDPGKGVSFQFRFRMPIVKTGALAAKLEKRWSLLPPGHSLADLRSSEIHRVDTIRKTS